ncbi:MAG: DUF72 domain-containing protein [Nitrososphaera sp.]
MHKLYVGCSGWSYDGWLGHFYPSNLDRKDFLKYYSQVFDFVEIDSSFYTAPNVFMTKRWASLTPENFRFTAKFPRSITHEKRLAADDSEKELRYFFDVMRPLRTKLLALLLQLPPSLTAKEGLKKLEVLIHMLDPDFRYAIEVRHESWFDQTVNRLLSKNNIALAWSQLDTIQTPTEATSDFLYLRFIGDRSIDERDFGNIQKDRTKELKMWSESLNRVKDKVKFAIVAANNHYAGFGPATANSFRKMVGLKEAVWEEMKQNRL